MKVATAAMILTAGTAVTLGAWQQEQPRQGVNQPGSTQPGQANRPAQASQPMNARTANMYAADYRSCHDLTGEDIVNWSNEDVGTVEDLMIERGSGQITHVVVKSGAVLGMGGSSVLVPFREFQWDSNRDRLVLGSQGVNDYPVYTPESWKGLRESQRPSTNWRERDAMNQGRTSDGRQPMPAHTVTGKNQPGDSTTRTPASGAQGETNTGVGSSGPASGTTAQGRGQATPNTGTNPPGNREDNRPVSAPRAQHTGEGATHATPADHDRMNRTHAGTPPLNDWMWDQQRTRQSDPYAAQWTKGSKQRIEGEIRSVERQTIPGQGEQVVLEIAGADGTTRKVSVGPSWYVTGGEHAFNRGDRVSIEAMPIYIATSAQVNNKTVSLRGDDGAAAWTRDSFQSGGGTYSAPYFRNLRVSDLKGAKLDCRGTACGSVNDVILEMNSGTVAFLSLDPDENFLGIADTKRLAPWSIISIGADGTVRVDAAKEMMTSAAETPSDITTLNQPGRVDSIYNAYQVPARDFNRLREDDDRFNDQGRRERETWRRDQNFRTTPSDSNTNTNPDRRPGTDGERNPR